MNVGWFMMRARGLNTKEQLEVVPGNEKKKKIKFFDRKLLLKHYFIFHSCT